MLTEKEKIDRLNELIKSLHEFITNYNPNKNLRSESDLDYIMYEAVKIQSKNPNLEEIELYQKQSAFLMYEIATKHPFFDGNKRTALIVFLFYRYSNTEINSLAKKYVNTFKNWGKKDDEIVDFMLSVAKGDYNYGNFLKRLKEIFK